MILRRRHTTDADMQYAELETNCSRNQRIALHGANVHESIKTHFIKRSPPAPLPPSHSTHSFYRSHNIIFLRFCHRPLALAFFSRKIHTHSLKISPLFCLIFDTNSMLPLRQPHPHPHRLRRPHRTFPLELNYIQQKIYNSLSASR